MIRGTFHSLHPLLAVGDTPMFVRKPPSSWVSWDIRVHDRSMALACGNVASYVDYIPLSAPPPTHSLIWDACVCPTTRFSRWNGSKSSVQVKWLSCVSLTLVRYMLSPAELLVFMSSTLLCGCSHPPGFNFVYWRTILTKKFKQNHYCFYNESLQSQSCDYPFSQKTSAHTFSLCYGVNCRRLCW